jgi:hypothetical protein
MGVAHSQTYACRNADLADQFAPVNAHALDLIRNVHGFFVRQNHAAEQGGNVASPQCKKKYQILVARIG